MPNFQAIKFPESIKINTDTTITNLQIVLNTQKNPYLNQAAQKILAKIFLPQNEFPKSNISNPKNSFNHPCHLKSGVPPWVRYS